MACNELENEVARRRAKAGDFEPVTPTPKNAVAALQAITVDRECVQCHQMFAALSIAGMIQRHCGPCCEALEAETATAKAEQLTADRRAAWESRLADLPKFREPFDRGLAIYGALELWERAQIAKHGAKPIADAKESHQAKIMSRLDAAIQATEAWLPSRKGIGLAGESGNAQTRLMFTLLERLYVSGMSVTFLTATEFGDEVSARFSEDSRDAKRWMERLSKVDVLFYDDMGKEALTERVAKEIFNLFDKRANARRPIFATANFTGDQLAKHYESRSPMIGAPIVNRLRDCCDFLPL